MKAIDRKKIAKIIGVMSLLLFASIVKAQSINQQFEDLKTRGINHLTNQAQKDLAYAITERYSQAHRNEPSKAVEAFYWGGKIVFSMGGVRNTNRAISLWEQARTLNHNFPGLQRELGLARLALGFGSYNEAREALSLAFQQNPNDVEALDALLNLYAADDSCEKRIEFRSLYLASHRKNILMRFKLVKDYIIAHKDREAEKQLDTVLEDSSDFVEARLLMASLLEKRQNYAEAAKHYDKAIKQKKDDRNILDMWAKAAKRAKVQEYISTANVKLGSGSPSDLYVVISTSDSALTLDPSNEYALRNRRDAQRKLFSRWYATADSLKKARPRNWRLIYEHFGNALLSADNKADQDKAFKGVREAATESGIEIRANNALGMARELMKKKEFERAAKIFAGVEEVIAPERKTGVTSEREHALLADNFNKGLHALRFDNDLARAYFLIVKKIKPDFRDDSGLFIDNLYSEADSLFRAEYTIQLWKTSFIKALGDSNWSAADVYLQNINLADSDYKSSIPSHKARQNHQLSVLETIADTLAKQQHLIEARTIYRILKRESQSMWDIGQKLNVLEEKLLSSNGIFIWLAVIGAIIFLHFIQSFSECVIALYRKMSAPLQSLAQKHEVGIKISFVSYVCLIIVAFFLSPLQKIVSETKAWANQNEGFLALIIFLLGVGSGVYLHFRNRNGRN